MKRTLLLSLSLSVLFAFAFVAHAQTDRSYHYTNFAETVTVHKDTTIRVEEEQTYQFVGTYHLGYRSIPHKALDAITDVTVVDGETGKAFALSRLKLSKDDPSSWGKYTVYEQNGETIVEWYYDLSNTTHRFIISYTVHGALAFYKDHDELYWNIFTDYNVPVDRVEVTIQLPGAITQQAKSLYTSGSHEYTAEQPNESTFHFVTTGIAPNEAVTFAVGWQKGLVDQSAYWRDFARTYWALLASVLIILGGYAYSAWFWFRRKRQNHGRGTIIPEYEPPQYVPPAMAAVVAMGHVTQNAWPATVVDLAVRGFVTIKEDTSKVSLWRNPKTWVFIDLLFVLSVPFVIFVLFSNNGSTFAGYLPLLLIPYFGVYVLMRYVQPQFNFLKSTDYVVTTTKKSTETLEPYEKQFLDALCNDNDTFSTRLLRRSQSKARELYTKLQRISKELSEETQERTHAFGISPNSFLAGMFSGTLVVSIMWLFIVPFIFSRMPGLLWLAGSCVLVSLLVVGIRYVPYLTSKGAALKEEWLGFKMYLETAERYRMQNLTPETFEKYLPYAMIFGVEKEWAKAFETLNMQQPTWYVGSNAAFVSSGPTGGFSPSSFTSGFSASFASSFASSGGGGASGGGGGAGGGGGGGGGGAA